MATTDTIPSPETTVSDLLGLFIRDVGEMQTFGVTHLYSLRALQRRPIGAKIAAKLTSTDFIEHCRERQEEGVCAATINQDISYLRGPLKMARIMWGIPASEAPLLEAMPLLKKLHLVGKSTPRERRPQPDEIERLLTYFRERSGHHRAKIPMETITRFQIASGRRISETCRLLWEDLNIEDRTILVRDLKDPKRKKGTGNHAEAALLGESFDLIMAQPRIPGEPRIFPYYSKSISVAYTVAKKKLGIKNLRLHDSRRECASRMIEAAYSVPETMLVTLHKNPTILMRTYTKLRPKDLHKGPAAKRGKEALKDIAASVLIGSGALKGAPMAAMEKPRLRGPAAEACPAPAPRRVDSGASLHRSVL